MPNSVSKSVLVLGGSGMLGWALVDVLSASADLLVFATARTAALRDQMAGLYPGVRWIVWDIDQSFDPLIQAVGDGGWVINAIGLIKTHIHDDRTADVQAAIQINALFPHHLAAAARSRGWHIVQIATDCVYAGALGAYVETSPHDALDVYGKTKSLGEVVSDSVCHLRCSIIGPELKGKRSLLEWFLGQPHGTRLKGFSNHHWNGVTTLHFARLCLGMISQDRRLAGRHHILPADTMNKCRMLQAFAARYGRADLIIEPVEATPAVDRTLSTLQPRFNADRWSDAGYASPPTLEAMIDEMADWSGKLRR